MPVESASPYWRPLLGNWSRTRVELYEEAERKSLQSAVPERWPIASYRLIRLEATLQDRTFGQITGKFKQFTNWEITCSFRDATHNRNHGKLTEVPSGHSQSTRLPSFGRSVPVLSKTVCVVNSREVILLWNFRAGWTYGGLFVKQTVCLSVEKHTHGRKERSG